MKFRVDSSFRHVIYLTTTKKGYENIWFIMATWISTLIKIIISFYIQFFLSNFYKTTTTTTFKTNIYTSTNIFKTSAFDNKNFHRAEFSLFDFLVNIKAVSPVHLINSQQGVSSFRTNTAQTVPSFYLICNQCVHFLQENIVFLFCGWCFWCFGLVFLDFSCN